MSASGSSSCQTICSNWQAISEPTLTTWRSTSKYLAARSAYGRSRTNPSCLASSGSKSIVKHCSRAIECCRAKATTALESNPPERKAPTGTSEIIWRSTAVANRCRMSTTQSSIECEASSPGEGKVWCRQRRTIRPSRTIKASPGSIFWISASGVRGPGHHRYFT